MDSYYDSQMSRHSRQMPQAFAGGPPRQFGSGAAGLGALAVRVGRSTLPLLKRYVLPVAKELGQHLISTTIPELGNVLSGKKKVKRAVKDSVKKSVKNTIKGRLNKAVGKNSRGGGQPSPARHDARRRKPSGGRAGGGGRARSAAGGAQSAVPPKKQQQTRGGQPLKRRKSSFSSNLAGKRSRVDILENVSFV